MEAKPKYAKPRSLSVLMALRILFLLGFLFGCLFARTSQIAMAPVSGSVWFRGPFETGTDFPFVFSAFLFDSLFYALPIFLFGMTFLGVLVIPAAIILKGFTLGTSLTALIRLEGIGLYFRRCFDYLPMTMLCITVLLLLAAEALCTARRSCPGVFRKRRTAFRKKLHRAVFACVCGAGFHFDFIRCIALFDFANLDFKAKEAEMNEHG